MNFIERGRQMKTGRLKKNSLRFVFPKHLANVVVRNIDVSHLLLNESFAEVAEDRNNFRTKKKS